MVRKYQIDKMTDKIQTACNATGIWQIDEKRKILRFLTVKAEQKYDDFVIQGGIAVGYNLEKLKGSLFCLPDYKNFDLHFDLYGPKTRNKKHVKRDLAVLFEYGTGTLIVENPNRRRYERRNKKAPIKAKRGKVIVFKSKKFGKKIVVNEVKGVRPIFAMQKTVKFMENNINQLLNKAMETL